MQFRILPTVLTCVCALVLLSAGAILVLNIVTTRSIVGELESRAVNRGLQLLETVLRGHLDAAGHQAEYIAAAIRSGEIAFNRPDELLAFVSGSLAAVPDVAGLLVVAPDGRGVRGVRNADGDVVMGTANIRGDAVLTGIAEEARSQREPFWGPPLFRDYLQDTILNLRVPIWRGNEFLGFIATGVSTRTLSQFALERSNPPDSAIYVLYGGDKVLAHMYLVLETGRVSVDKPLLAIGEIIDPVMRALGSATPWHLAGLSLPPGAEALQLEANQQPYLLVQKSVPGYADLPLMVGAYAVASSVEAPFRLMQRTILIGIGLLAVALIASVAISRMITGPIRKTSESVARIATLDFDQAAPLQRSYLKEVDDLAGSFNSMLVGLRSFGRYVPQTLVKRLIRENRVGAGTEERDLAIMFTDIVGFTPLCEGMSPGEVADFINHHLGLVSQCIEREGGTIDKYIGDAVMAFWGAPDRAEDAPLRAARAAVAIQRAIAEDNAARAKSGLPTPRIRIGIHSGPAIVGDIGAPMRINYTVVGDVVNTAQRLESLGKEVDPEAEAIALVSERIVDALDGSLRTEAVGEFQMKGKQRPLPVYRIFA